MARRPAFVLSPWAHKCEGQDLFLLTQQFSCRSPLLNARAILVSMSRKIWDISVAECPFPAAGPSSRDSSPSPDSGLGQWTGKRSCHVPRREVFGKPGCSWVRAYLVGSPLAAVTAGWQVTSSLPTVFVHSSFLKCVSGGEGEAGTEVGQAKTRGGGALGNSSLSLMICVQFKVREWYARLVRPPTQAYTI